MVFLFGFVHRQPKLQVWDDHLAKYNRIFGPGLAHRLTVFHSFLSNLLTTAAVGLFSYTVGTLILKQKIMFGRELPMHLIKEHRCFHLWSLPTLQASHRFFFFFLIAMFILPAVLPYESQLKIKISSKLLFDLNRFDSVNPNILSV